MTKLFQLKMPFQSFSLLAMLLVVMSCGKKQNYAYYQGFSQYMSEEYQIDLSATQDQIYYVIPFSSCNSCSSSSLNLDLLGTQLDVKKVENLTVILAGNIDYQLYGERINQLATSYKLIEDAKERIDQYQTGITKPILLHIRNGQIEKYLKINDLEIEAVKNYLG